MMAFEKKKKKEKDTGEKSTFCSILILDKNQTRIGKNKQQWTRLVHHGYIAQKIKNTHTTECVTVSAQFIAVRCSSSHPSPLQSCYPLPFAIMLTDSTDIL